MSFVFNTQEALPLAGRVDAKIWIDPVFSPLLLPAVHLCHLIYFYFFYSAVAMMLCCSAYYKPMNDI